MRYLTILFIQVSLGHYTNGQQSKYWGQLIKGRFEVGYQDTVLFNHDQQYTLGKYSGPKPYFVNIWFPTNSKLGKQIEYNDYLKLTPPHGTESVTDSIGKVQMASFIKWGVTYNLDFWENEKLTDSKNHLAKKLLLQRLDVFKTDKYPTARYPTIIYHHGNGGIPFENSILFEFLASHGYVIISADYHWPSLRERSYTHESDRSLMDVDFIAAFSHSLPFTDRQNLTYIGHSWGGGVALRLNQRGNVNFKRYLILDSTLEQAGGEEMKVMNPYLDSLLQNHVTDFKTSTVVITARGRYYENGDRGKPVIQPFPEFIPFTKLDKRVFTYITLKQILNHCSFTSVGVIRSVFSKEIPQNDAMTVDEQFATYQFLVTLIKEILVGNELNNNSLIINDK
jgi:pimeloyl-ACP methyl ester carboxylesterase